MRFAYIDSQGNEVPIPGVDALALRIELGAIGPETELYDAAADRWGPAKTHDIFHTLSRQMEEKGFVAPPPAAPGPPKDEEGDVRESSAADRPAAAARSSAKAEPEAPAEKAEPEAPAAKAEPEAPADEDEGGPARAGEHPAEGTDAGEEEPRFDFSGGLEVEEVEVEEVPLQELEAGEEEDSEDTPPERHEDILNALDFTLTPGSGAGEPGDGEAMDLSSEPEDGRARDDDWTEGGGASLEGPLAEEMDFSGAGDASGGLDLEPPMSDFSPDTPPAWMRDDASGGEDGDEDLLDFSRPSTGVGEDDDILAPRPGTRSGGGGTGPVRRERPKPRNRPSPPRRPRRKLPVGPLLGVLALAALGIAGWQYGWPALQAWQRAQRETPQAARPPVALPDLPENLMPRMRTLGQAALAGMIARLDSQEASFGLPARPRRDWLAGVYLANASRYPDIERYWVAVDSFVDHVRASDARIFHQQYVARLDSAGIEGDTARMLLERADSGFLATRADRIVAYDQMDDLVNAALDLHQFLLDNQDQISYEPAAAGMSRDPVLEAVPNSKELGDRMWGMVDRITGALDALGTLDQVTTKRLLGVLFERIRTAGFR